jgi:PBP1b-binding outer membrane lipoprotein LpoB
MKRLFILLAGALLFSACNNDNMDDSADTPTKETATPAAATTPVDSAKALLLEAQKYMEKGIRKEMTGQEANEKIKPVMAQFMEIYKRLPPADTAVIYQFRMQQFQEMVNLQVAEQQKQQKQ